MNDSRPALAASPDGAKGAPPVAGSGSDPAIRIRNLVFERGDQAIFDNVDIDIPRGKITAIMGPSGTGKTTLLRLITGQLHPKSGDIRVDGMPIQSLRSRELYALRMRMGMLFQNGALLTDLNVFENVAFPLREHTNLNESMIRTLVLMKLQAVGLRGATEMMPSTLSGGMERRVALARAMIMDPEFIFYDEPFTGLDPISLGAIVRLISRLNHTLGLTTVIVSHDVGVVESITDINYLISEGKVVAHGSPEDLRENRSSWVRQFMTGIADGPVPFHFPAPDYDRSLLEEDH
ncbi:MAG: ABC transporter ATP-binding protein [Gammaproteobacteria bacterium]